MIISSWLEYSGDLWAPGEIIFATVFLTNDSGAISFDWVSDD
jgi:hypothetical protein